jgi:hypothetical protein
MKCRMLLVVAGMIAVSTLRGAADETVEIRINGRYFAAPATVQMVIAVEPDAANRTLKIEADGDQLYRSTEVSLEGQAEKRLHNIEFKNLPAGSYEVRAEVLSGASSVRGTATQELEVMGR